MKFRLAQKGLIIAAVPMIFELLIIGFLFHHVGVAEVEAQNAIRARRISVAFTQMTADAVHLMVTMGQYKITDKGLSPIFKQEMAHVRTDMEKTRALVQDDPLYRPMIQTSSDLVAIVDKITADLLASYEKGDLEAVTNKSDEYKRSIYKLAKNPETMRPFKEYVRAENEKYRAEPAMQAQLRQRTRLLLSAGLLISALISIFTSAFFSIQITRRLKTMTQNNELLKARKPLNPPVPGSDEIADLDRTLHSMAQAVQSAREKERANQQLREQVVQMVTHDLRTPLQTVTTFLEFMETTDVQPEVRGLLEKALANAESMSQRINDLLKAEKEQDATVLVAASLAPAMPSE